MDPRCEPTQFVGSGNGPFATVSNAGGRVTSDAIRSILVFRSLFAALDGAAVAVITHTGEWMSYLTVSGIIESYHR